MTDLQIFEKLFNGGAYTLPYLIAFTHPSLGNLYFINATNDVTYNGKTYKSSSFKYTEPDNQGDGASLEISLQDDKVLSLFIDKADYRMQIEVRGLLRENNTIQPLSIYKHMYATLSISADKILKATLGKDDRMKMTFPPYLFDADNNRGNQ